MKNSATHQEAGRPNPLLEMDFEAEADRIADFVRSSVRSKLRKRGVVVAVSGGIDSSTTAALCVRAVGRSRVYALLLPERDSSSDSSRFGRMLVDHLGIDAEEVDITPILDRMGCYRRRDEAIQEVLPVYTPEFKSKIVLRSKRGAGASLNLFSVVIEGPDGRRHEAQLPLRSYLHIVAATNMKQRTRKALEYFHADRLNYAVVGTPNYLEYDQGFFVKLGDGAADIKPIAHLYKTQVYAMARHLNLPEELCQRTPSTDTYSLEQSQEEFYFELPYPQMDQVMHGMQTGADPSDVAAKSGLTEEQVLLYTAKVRRKRAATAPLHLPPLTLVSNGRTNDTKESGGS